MSLNIDKYAKLLSDLSGYSRQALILREVFEKYVFSSSKTAAGYIWMYYADQVPTAKTVTGDAFVQHSEKILGVITDKDQIKFYLKVFSNGKEMMSQSAFMDFLRSAYVLYRAVNKMGTGEEDSDASSPAAVSWIESVSKSAYHIKDEMSVCFLTTWILTNLPRMLNPMHKYIVGQLTTGYNKIKSGDKSSPASRNDAKSSESNGEDETVEDPTVSLIHPILMWFLRSSLPGKFLSVLDKKPESHKNAATTPQQLMEMLNLGEAATPETWSLLYDSEDQGLSINRFQHHVFNYRGPTLMFVKADNDYLFCIATDIEWRESCHFWGGEESLLLMVKPEFRIVEKGAKIFYANFSIRGYPFGIQVGKDPRNLSIEIKPEFTYVSYKQIPCKIIRLLAWGCAPPQVKVSQHDLRKWEAKQAEKNRKINLSNPEWKDNPDKYLLELAGSYKSYDNQ
ncbi:unnamed protein product [Orchesella dallaii]|uniref:TLDc domain-containing protein n=1 Tax=Orchesella dallaii TaxID=48710 RepID=A0ABP1QZN3_9HEXA